MKTALVLLCAALLILSAAVVYATTYNPEFPAQFCEQVAQPGWAVDNARWGEGGDLICRWQLPAPDMQPPPDSPTATPGVLPLPNVDAMLHSRCQMAADAQPEPFWSVAKVRESKDSNVICRLRKPPAGNWYPTATPQG